MYIIGLTGGIASGKSLVSSMLTEWGAYIIDGDKIAHEIVAPQLPAWQDIVNYFGSDILLPDNNINRKLLGNIVFKDKAARQKLEDFTHRRIQDKIIEKINYAKTVHNEIVVLDIPLLIELGWQYMVDEVWLVYVDLPIQIARLCERNGLTYEEATMRINAQMSLNKKKQYANVLIDNNHSIEQTRSQVLIAWNNVKDKTAMTSHCSN